MLRPVRLAQSVGRRSSLALWREREMGSLEGWRERFGHGACKGEAARVYGTAATLLLTLIAVLHLTDTLSLPYAWRLVGLDLEVDEAKVIEREGADGEHMGSQNSYGPRACEIIGRGPSSCPNLFRAVRFGTRSNIRDGPFKIAASECWDQKPPPSELENKVASGANASGLGEVWGAGPGIAAAYTMYTPREACDIVSSFNGVFLIGDSLIRHVTQALFLVLSGDLESGALRWWAEDEKEALKMCGWQEQFMEKKCRRLVLTSTTQFPPSPAVRAHYCPNHNFTLSYLGIIAAKESGIRRRRDQLVRSMNDLRALLSAHALNPAIILSPSALHFSLKTVKARTRVGNMHRTIRNMTRGAVEILAPLHALFPEKKPTRYKSQTMERAVEVVDDLRTFAEGGLDGRGWQGMEVFDTINMTRECESFDGTHFTTDVNVLKAQLLLNRLDQIRRERDLRPQCHAGQ